jgi:hypothetical protein
VHPNINGLGGDRHGILGLGLGPGTCCWRLIDSCFIRSGRLPLYRGDEYGKRNCKDQNLGVLNRGISCSKTSRNHAASRNSAVHGLYCLVMGYFDVIVSPTWEVLHKRNFTKLRKFPWQELLVLSILPP